MGIGEYIVIGICAVLLGWFLVGSYMNSTKTERGFAWLHRLLKPYGKMGAATRFDPSSIGARLTEIEKNSPFEKMDVTITLVRRENFPLWLLQRFTRPDDLLIFKSALRRLPSGEIHLLLSGDQKTHDVLQSGIQKPLVNRQEVGKYALYTRGEVDKHLLSITKSLAEKYPLLLKRVSFQIAAPHFIAHLKFDLKNASEIEQFLTELSTDL